MLVSMVYSALFGFWWLWAPLVAVLVWLYGFTVPVVIVTLIDGYFGAWTHIPLLTLVAIVIGLSVVSVKPYVYTIRNV